MGTIHASFGAFKDVRSKVLASRGSLNAKGWPQPFFSPPFLAAEGVTLVSNATRHRPNCFSFVRQITILQRAGGGSAEQQFQVGAVESRVCCVDTSLVWPGVVKPDGCGAGIPHRQE